MLWQLQKPEAFSWAHTETGSLLGALVRQKTLRRPLRPVWSYTDALRQERLLMLQKIDPDDSLSLRRIAERLNTMNVPTVSGKGSWSANSVKRLKAVF